MSGPGLLVLPGLAEHDGARCTAEPCAHDAAFRLVVTEGPPHDVTGVNVVCPFHALVYLAVWLEEAS